MIELSSLDQAFSLLKKTFMQMGNPPIHYVGNRGTDALALQSILEKIDYPLDTVVCLDYSPEHEQIPATNVVSYEKYNKQRTTQYSRLWQDGLFQTMLEKEGIRLAPGSLLFCFSNFPELEVYCQQNKIKILSAMSKFRGVLENKIQLICLLSNEGIPSLPNVVAMLKDVDLELYCQYFKTDKLVFQIPVSVSGNGTFFILNKDEFLELHDRFTPETVFKITPYVQGISFAVTGCLTDHGPVWVPPAVQIIGEDIVGILSPREPVYSGSDFFASQKIITKYMKLEYLESIANSLHRLGFRGIYNFDILSNGHHFCDLNSRCPGSIRMITELELINNEIPIVLIQMLHFLGKKFRVSKTFQEFPKAASLLVLHSLKSRFNNTEFKIDPGVFKPEGTRWSRVRYGSRISDLKDNTEILFTGGIPSDLNQITSEAPLGRIWMKKTVVDERLRVTPEALQTAQEISNMMMGNNL